MKNLKSLLMAVLLLTTATVFAQTNLSGKVVDEINQPLPGATVVIQGSKIGVSTDFDGNFDFNSSISSGTLLVSFVGYESKTISFNGSGNVGTISLKPSAETLEEIVITQTSFAIDRKTPVAVSTIKADVIENKLGTQEFPEILKSTPGVYATKSGGGFGDGRLNLRGFDSQNVAVMINGVPVNDMENGRVYWSNWAGLSDVTSAMQVQRGLGASKVAVPSVGGTVNIMSKTTDVQTGGNFNYSFGNDNYQKLGATLSTGLLDNGWAASVSGSATRGDGYVDGTEFQGYNYFFNLSKQISAKHKLALTTFGAPQVHGQRQNRNRIERYQNAESGIRFNPDWGILNGSVLSVEDNFYHKNQTSLNWYWTISEKSDLSTVLYGSWGRGGGGGTGGDTELFTNRLGGNDQPIDLDYIQSVNMERGEVGLGSAAWLRASRNDHDWYGVLSTFKTDFTDAITLVAGIDLRTYTGHHFTEVTDLLGGAYVLPTASQQDVNNPNVPLKVGDKYSYYDDGKVGWAGFFTQAEYEKDDLALFLAASISNTSYQRIDYFQYLDGDPLQTSDKYNFFGYMIKGGANYNITLNHNVFANIGYFTKAPGFDAVFPRNNNEDINASAADEKIFSMEIGYGYRSEKLSGNVNIYRTKWNDRTFSRFIPGADGTNYFLNILGVNALHQGIEIDGTYKPFPYLTFTGMLSLGDWIWDSNVEDAQLIDEDSNPIGNPVNLQIDGLKVGNSAQTTAALGVDYEFMPKTHITLDYNYFGNLYADFDPLSRTVDEIDPDPELVQPWEMPAYGTFDASLRYGFKVGTFDTMLTARMYNIFNTEYIADANDGSYNDAASALVWYGFGRTFNFSVKFSF
jgi:outer membrane cobalamin receptor